MAARNWLIAHAAGCAVLYWSKLVLHCIVVYGNPVSRYLRANWESGGDSREAVYSGRMLYIVVGVEYYW